MHLMTTCPRCGSDVLAESRFCGQCGESMVGGPGAGPARVSRNVLILSLVFLVALAVILFGMYEWIQIATTVPPVPKPTVTFASAVTLGVGSAWLLRVLSTSSGVAPTYYRMLLAVDGYSGSAVQMPPYSGQGVSVYVPYSNYPFYISWSDIDGSGTLTTGDTFTISYGGYPSLTNGTALSFSLLWNDSSTVASASWTA